jgi:hypothetical protein
MNASIVAQTRDKEYEMPLFALPDPQDLADIIADRLDALCSEPLSAETRAQVIDNCIAPVTLMMRAGEMACAAGEREQMVFVHMIATLAAQAETAKWMS